MSDGLILRFDGGVPFGRYAENWDQKGTLFRLEGLYSGPDVAGAELVDGPELGWNNYLDMNAGLMLLPSCCGVDIPVLW